MKKGDHSDVVKEHFDLKYVDYDPLIRSLIPRYEEMHRAVVDAVDVPSDKDTALLDLGIGTGQTALALLEKFPRLRIDGIDLSTSMVAHGKTRLQRHLDRISFHIADMKDFSPARIYDACVGVLSIHHLDPHEKRELFEKIHPTLKPGAVFVIGDIVKFDSDQETREKELEWKGFLKGNLGEEGGEFWFRNYQEEDLPDSVPKQLSWLRSAGFSDARCVWAHMNYAVIVARR